MLATALLLPATAASTPAPGSWTGAISIPSVFDVTGPRSDGRLVVATAGKLLLLDPATGALAAYAGGTPGFPGTGGAEAYLVLSTGIAGPGCSFGRDDVFILQPAAPLGVLRIDHDGAAHPFATVPGVDALNGIAFDTTGKFGHRLLVTGPHAGHTTVAAIDCNGAAKVITAAAPVAEGGIAVAPAGFGSFGGELAIPDELSGKVYAVAPDGAVHLLASPALAAGPDTGVEGIGFVPPGSVSAATAFYADRGTPGNPHPGTDHLLVLAGSALSAAGARAGDLLVATEGGAGLVGIRCGATCDWNPIVPDNAISHGEGHIILLAGPVAASPAPAAVRAAASTGPPAALISLLVVLALLVLGGGAWVLRRRRGA